MFEIIYIIFVCQPNHKHIYLEINKTQQTVYLQIEIGRRVSSGQNAPESMSRLPAPKMRAVGHEQRR